MGTHGTLSEWEEAGRPNILEEAREKVFQLLKDHDPLPLPEEVVRELDQLGERMLTESIKR
jgi:trimethylamine:corrinoid methyltransferase-like protein